MAFVSLPAYASVEMDQPAPSLVVERLDGKTFDLLALKGKVVIVNFWATWCAPCRQEMPALDAFYRKHHAEGIEMIAVSVDRRGGHNEVEDVMKGYSFPAAMFSDISSSGFGMPSAIPVTYVIDEGGIVRAILSPERAETTESLLNATILPLLSHKNAI